MDYGWGEATGLPLRSTRLLVRGSGQGNTTRGTLHGRPDQQEDAYLAGQFGPARGAAGSEAGNELGAGAGTQRNGRHHIRVFRLEGATLYPPQGPPAQSSSRKRPPIRENDAPPTKTPKIRTP